MRLTLATALLAAASPAFAQSSDAGFGSPTRFLQRDGAALYAAICAGCHMPDGRGARGAGTYPALTGNPRLEAAGYPLTVVANGRNGMPGFASQLDDPQLAAVVNFVRTSLGNSWRDPVTPEDAKAVRP